MEKKMKERITKNEMDTEAAREGLILTPELLEKHLKSFRMAQAKQKQRYGVISILRLFVFALIVVGLLLAVLAHFWWGWLIVGVSLIVFIRLVLYHIEIGDIQDCLERLIQVYESYQKRFQDKWHSFPENGSEYSKESDYVAADLDVLGPDSLYQMLCTAHTSIGKRRLAEVLSQNRDGDRISVEQLQKRQEAVAELARRNQFALNFESLALKYEAEQEESESKSLKRGQFEQEGLEPKAFEQEESEEAGGQEIGDGTAEDKEERKEKSGIPGLLRILAWAYPILFLCSIIGAFFHWWKPGVILVLFFSALFFSWCMAGFCQRKMGDLFRHSRSVQAYIYMMDSFVSEQLEASCLKELQETIMGGQGKHDNLLIGLKRLEALITAYNVRYNPIAHWLLSGICLYDLHLADHAVKWEQQYGESLKQGIAALGEVEMLSSLAVLERIGQVSYPRFIETDLPQFSMKQVFHPLLPTASAVANDISLSHETVIITGSNMSGKTTFLRTVGLNLILAYAGAPVCSTEMYVSPMRIFTSMRVTDDVSHGISTFYAELLRIKEMVAYKKQNRPMLCLVDEIFKGTNSADRIVGAEAVIQRLSGGSAILMVSTHDFELCKLANNYHFEEYYEEDRLKFDYQLRKGICTTTNALYLLKMAGLTEIEKN